jgi:hypothetical protein
MPELDSIVQAVIAKFESRAAFGKAKYGTDLDRTDLSVLQWIQHAQEEHMDAILYLEKLKKTLETQPIPALIDTTPLAKRCNHVLGTPCSCGHA